MYPLLPLIFTSDSPHFHPLVSPHFPLASPDSLPPSLLPRISPPASPHFRPASPDVPPPPLFSLISPLSFPDFPPYFASSPPLLPLISPAASPNPPLLFLISPLPLISAPAFPHFPPFFPSFPPLLPLISCFSSLLSLISLAASPDSFSPPLISPPASPHSPSCFPSSHPQFFLYFPSLSHSGLYRPPSPNSSNLLPSISPVFPRSPLPSLPSSLSPLFPHSPLPSLPSSLSLLYPLSPLPSLPSSLSPLFPLSPLPSLPSSLFPSPLPCFRGGGHQEGEQVADIKKANRISTDSQMLASIPHLPPFLLPVTCSLFSVHWTSCCAITAYETGSRRQFKAAAPVLSGLLHSPIAPAGWEGQAAGNISIPHPPPPSPFLPPPLPHPFLPLPPSPFLLPPSRAHHARSSLRARAATCAGRTPACLHGAQSAQHARAGCPNTPPTPPPLRVLRFSTEGGLRFYDVAAGKGTLAERGDPVVVHFDVTYRSLTVVSSRQSKLLGGNRVISQPYEFSLGAKPGAERKRDYAESANGLFSAQAAPKPPRALYSVVAGMRVGGKRTVIVPPEQGYGDKGFAEIPPGATIQLTVELLEVKAPPS
ncbi:unnamed protein product [Closterium sp. Naga37s-1]|nr:unnamed protein product [Closterium sp. Naga37s-1]